MNLNLNLSKRFRKRLFMLGIGAILACGLPSSLSCPPASAHSSISRSTAVSAARA